ncbi:MAG TPA: Hsp20/alpha crystallin family protein [Candidatus Sumerlaeota bacterium]|nr:Hsp20/alpha crystallin family protein [Candidatus Sumerlaeota bacterium]
MLRFFDTNQDFQSLRRDIDRAFDAFRTNGAAFRQAFLPGRNPRNYPHVNIAEDADTIHVEALAPGLNPDSIQITVLRNQLTIAGEKPAEASDVKAEQFHRCERAGGRFVRTFTLPAEVNDAKVAAEYRSGILTITLPKAETAKPKKINVAVA